MVRGSQNLHRKKEKKKDGAHRLHFPLHDEPEFVRTARRLFVPPARVVLSAVLPVTATEGAVIRSSTC